MSLILRYFSPPNQLVFVLLTFRRNSQELTMDQSPKRKYSPLLVSSEISEGEISPERNLAKGKSIQSSPGSARPSSIQSVHGTTYSPSSFLQDSTMNNTSEESSMNSRVFSKKRFPYNSNSMSSSSTQTFTSQDERRDLEPYMKGNSYILSQSQSKNEDKFVSIPSSENATRASGANTLSTISKILESQSKDAKTSDQIVEDAFLSEKKIIVSPTWRRELRNRWKICSIYIVFQLLTISTGFSQHARLRLMLTEASSRNLTIVTTFLYFVIFLAANIAFFKLILSSPGYLTRKYDLGSHSEVPNCSSSLKSSDLQSRNSRPGLFPHSGARLLSEDYLQNQHSLGTNVSVSDVPTDISVQTNESQPKLQSCFFCKIQKPERAKHCYYCNRCVCVFDHHCQLLDKCIGGRNRAIFLYFLSIQLMYLIYNLIIILGSIQILHFMQIRTGAELFFQILGIFLNVPFAFYTAALWILHMYLMCANSTTYEIILRYRLRRGITSQQSIPNYSASLCENLRLFCSNDLPENWTHAQIIE